LLCVASTGLIQQNSCSSSVAGDSLFEFIFNS
jgi:hypothetical protein